jgi:magnesium-transporting ATPase (P-type)
MAELGMTFDEEQVIMGSMNQSIIDSMNVPQGRAENKQFLDNLSTDGFGGVETLIQMIGVDLAFGLTPLQIIAHRLKFGTNTMPKSPKTSYLMLLFAALSDVTLLILIAAASVSFAIGKCLGSLVSHELLVSYE